MHKDIFFAIPKPLRVTAKDKALALLADDIIN